MKCEGGMARPKTGEAIRKTRYGFLREIANVSVRRYVLAPAFPSSVTPTRASSGNGACAMRWAG